MVKGKHCLLSKTLLLLFTSASIDKLQNCEGKWLWNILIYQSDLFYDPLQVKTIITTAAGLD